MSTTSATWISRRIRRGIIGLAISTAIFFLQVPTWAQVHPAKTWKTISLEHFELIYDAQNQELAEVYALRLDNLVKTLEKSWTKIPAKTVVVLNDRTDLTNGYATFLPYPLIMIFPVLPGPMNTIGEYKDWSWEILVHEYTHILEFEQRRGVVTGLSYVFGNIVTPNALLPRWSLEGAAVEAETRHSEAGRLRSKMQAASLRAMAQVGDLEKVRLSEINEFSIPTWPYGARPYLFGSLLWSDWVENKNEAATRDLHILTGGRLPYMLETPFTEVFDGKGQVQLWDETRKEAQDWATAELNELRAKPLTEGKNLDTEMVESLSPAISPDALKLAYIGKNDILRRRVQVLVRPSKDVAFESSHRMEWFGREFEQSLPSGSPIPRMEDAPPGGNITRVSWHPDSRSFVFDQVYEKNRFKEQSDLWIFDLVEGRATKMTIDERAREPAFSPTGEKIAFVRVQAGKTDLALWDVASKTSKDIYSSPMQGRVSFPSWLDKDTLLFSLRINGQDKVMKLNLSPATNGETATNPIVEVLAGTIDPQFVSVEKDRILFTATNNGVRNLYTVNRDFKDLRPVTHSGTHVMAASYDEAGKTYYFTEITERGLQLRSLPEAKSAAATIGPDLPKTKLRWAARYEKAHGPDFAALSATGESKSKVAEAEDYSTWGYMLPRWWLPFISWDDKGTYLTAQTSASDPLGKHAYALTAAYDSSISRTSGIFQYVNQSFWPQLSLVAYDYSLPAAEEGDYSRTRLFQGSAAWEIGSVSPDWFVGFGGMSTERSRFGKSSQRLAPFVSTSYNNAFQSAAQISPESGWMGSLVLSMPHDKDLDRTFYAAEGSATLFWSKWLPARHALMLKTQGKYSDEILQAHNMEQSISQQTSSLTPFAEYLNRGYPSGAFLAKSISSTTFEYRMPFQRLDWAKDTIPFYAHRSHLAFVSDVTLFDGYLYDFRKDESGLAYGYRRSEWGRVFGSIGAELKYDFNLGYAIPLTTGVGIYYPLDTSSVEAGPRLGIMLIL